MDGNPAGCILLFSLFIALNAILNMFLSSVEGLSESTVEKHEQKEPKKAKKLLQLMEDSSKLSITLFIFMIVMALVTGIFVLPPLTDSLYGWLTEHAGDIFISSFLKCVSYLATALYLLLIMGVFSFFVPRCFGIKHSETCSFRLCSFVSVLMAILSPVNWLIQAVSSLVLFAFGMNLKELEEEVTEEEIKSMIDEGHEQGVLEEDEAEMISNIFEFGDKVARDIMTHRKNIVALDGEMTLKEAVDFILDNNYSRYPVYEGDIDNIIGILHVKDAMIYYSREKKSEESLLSLRNFLREPVFIPETRNINTLFKDMQSEKTHMEIVIDEYGQTAGVVAMEDILEEIVGNIFDEYDEEEHNIIACEDGSYLVKGMTELDELEEELGISFDTEDFDTLNGYLISHLDRILSENDLPEITVGRCHFDVISVENKLISLVRITVLDEDTEEEQEDDTEKEKK